MSAYQFSGAQRDVSLKLAARAARRVRERKTSTPPRNVKTLSVRINVHPCHSAKFISIFCRVIDVKAGAGSRSPTKCANKPPRRLSSARNNGPSHIPAGASWKRFGVGPGAFPKNGQMPVTAATLIKIIDANTARTVNSGAAEPAW